MNIIEGMSSILRECVVRGWSVEGWCFLTGTSAADGGNSSLCIHIHRSWSALTQYKGTKVDAP